ncbi:hypothetical protein D3C86_1273640 [compost metagenome]
MAVDCGPAAKSETLSPWRISMPRRSHRPRNAPTRATFGTIWANGLPSSTAPSNVRNTGRTGSAVFESVTIILWIGWASGSISLQMPKTSSIRVAAAMMADARTSFTQTSSGAASTTCTFRCRAACLIATATERPTYPPPATTTSSITLLLKSCARIIGAL